jgi:hypothetical protein
VAGIGFYHTRQESFYLSQPHLNVSNAPGASIGLNATLPVTQRAGLKVEGRLHGTPDGALMTLSIGARLRR